jgi:hypothetical protein
MLASKLVKKWLSGAGGRLFGFGLRGGGTGSPGQNVSLR